LGIHQDGPGLGWGERFQGLAAAGVEGLEELADAVFDFWVLGWIDHEFMVWFVVEGRTPVQSIRMKKGISRRAALNE
jgi:hypothetical protein